MLRTLLPLLVVLLGSTHALAQASTKRLSQQLTAQGRIMGAGSMGGFWSNDSSYFWGNYATWTLRANPSATYFLRDGFGVTFGLQGAYSASDLFPEGSIREREVGIGGGLRWNVLLGERWSLLVSPLVGYSYLWSTTRLRSWEYAIVNSPRPDGVTVPRILSRSSRHALGVSLSLPFLFALNDRVAIGLGPDLSYDYLFGGERRTRVLNMTRSSANSGGGHRLQLGASVGVYGSF